MKSKGLCITFLLPGPGHIPVGGLKVAYEYANGLSRLGHAVVVVHPASLYIDTPLKRKPRLMAGYIYREISSEFLVSVGFFRADALDSFACRTLRARRRRRDCDRVANGGVG